MDTATDQALLEAMAGKGWRFCPSCRSIQPSESHDDGEWGLVCWSCWYSGSPAVKYLKGKLASPEGRYEGPSHLAAERIIEEWRAKQRHD